MFYNFMHRLLFQYNPISSIRVHELQEIYGFFSNERHHYPQNYMINKTYLIEYEYSINCFSVYPHKFMLQCKNFKSK